MRKLIMIAAALALSAALMTPAAAQSAQSPSEICTGALPAADPDTRTYTQAEPVIAPGVDYYAILCTGVGAVYIDLLEDYAPLAVNNFVFLAQEGYYNNTTFHRVIADFMAQGGDPTATGSGGPGYQFADEFSPYITFKNAGLLAMANAGQGTNGSQFFITTAPTPHLDFRHTIFGAVLAGQDNVALIRLRDPASDPDPGTALQTVVIITDPASVTISAEPPTPSDTTAEQIETALGAIVSSLPDGLIVDPNTSGIFSTEDVIAAAPESARADYADLLARHNHSYRVVNQIDTTTCDPRFGFWSIGYTVDAFATAADAGAALADGGLFDLPTADGYSAAAIPALANPLFTRSENACDVPSRHAISHFQRGRFIVAAEVVQPEAQEGSVDQWLIHLVGGEVYETLLRDIFAAEL